MSFLMVIFLCIYFCEKYIVSEVKTDKIGLWGSSFSGGHVIVTAAKHPHKDRIGAVVSQVF